MKKAKTFIAIGVAFTLFFAAGVPAFGAHWADPHYAYLKTNNVLNTDFGAAPEAQKNQPISRAEFFALVVSALYGKQVPVSAEAYFSDFSSVPAPLSGYLSKAYKEKILTGIQVNANYYIYPSQPISRQDAATVLGRALDLSINLPSDFTDNSSIASYAKDYVTACEKTGILSGYPTGEFLPKGSITWAESVKIISAAMQGNLVTPLKVTLLAGNGAKGTVNKAPLTSSFNHPSSLTILQGNLYIVDTGNNKIRKLTGNTVSDFAGRILGYTLYDSAVNGYRDDKAAQALFATPTDIFAFNTSLLLADAGNNSIRQVLNDSVYTFAGTGKAGYKDGTNKEAQFNNPNGVCADTAGNVYIADTNNHVIRKIDGTGTVTTLAGKAGTAGYKDGAASSALFNSPCKVAYSNGTLYVSDSANNRIRAIKNGAVTTLAGSGTEIYDGTSEFIGGYKDGAAAKAMFNNPTGLSVSPDGTVYVADTGNALIRGIKNHTVFTVAGLPKRSAEGTIISADFVNPTGLYLSGNTLYVTDSLRNTISGIALK